MINFSSNSPSENIHARTLYKLDKLYFEIYVYKYAKIVKSEAINVKESRDEYRRGFKEKKKGREKCCIIITTVRLNIIISKIKVVQTNNYAIY